ncbi:MAG TPA: PEP-CTERM sorting domain-containing protein [Roseiarcus sp.]|nr:PEP-CTERM sorting domain-containing protein [Roseiarcus sp.]
MRKMVSVAAIAAALALPAVGAQSQTLEIGYGSAGSITQIASSSPPFLQVVGPDFYAQAFDFFAGTDLGSSTATIAYLGNGTETIWITETGLNIGPTPQNLLFTTGLTQNNVPVGASITETTYFDAANTPFGTGTVLATDTFTSAGYQTSSMAITAYHPYSLTEEYTITVPPGAPPVILSSISLQTTAQGAISVVPEASTWGMMLLGFGGLGFVGYRSSRRGAALAF